MKTSLRRLGAVLLTLTLALGLLSGCGAAPISDDFSASYEEDWGSAPAASQDASQSAGESDPEPDALPEDGSYTSAQDVAAYLVTYGHLPGNFITKKEARALGWEGGSLEPYAPGCCIGGDRFGNYEGTLPEGDYHECDIDTLGADRRGAKRLVYSDDGRIYYTEDHYESFTLLYGEEISEELAQTVCDAVTAKLPDDLEVALINGGQPVYYFVISVE